MLRYADASTHHESEGLLDLQHLYEYTLFSPELDLRPRSYNHLLLSPTLAPLPAEGLFVICDANELFESIAGRPRPNAGGDP